MASTSKRLSKVANGLWLLQNVVTAFTTFWRLIIGFAFKKTVARDRLQLGRSVRTSFVILDAQSVKNTEPAEHKGYDGGKKIAGIKRHLAVDINGLPIAIHITTANVSERDGGVALLSLNDGQFELVKRIMADGGYTGDDFAQSVRSVIGADVIIAKQSDLKNGYVTPQRWIVERTFSWLEKWRRLWFNCERQLHTSQMMVTLAFVTILLRRHWRFKTHSYYGYDSMLNKHPLIDELDLLSIYSDSHVDQCVDLEILQCQSVHLDGYYGIFFPPS